MKSIDIDKGSLDNGWLDTALSGDRVGGEGLTGAMVPVEYPLFTASDLKRVAL